jgi:SAM-dependent methyltransferase
MSARPAHKIQSVQGLRVSQGGAGVHFELNKAPGTEPPKDVADSMAEPFLSEFQAMVRAGASAQDIHDLPADAGFASTDAEVSDAYVRREVGRVRMHQRSLCPLLEKYVGPVDNILDVGCSTGGTTVAVALSQWLKPSRVVGVDPNGRALEAARVRGLGYGLGPGLLSFRQNRVGRPLPFPDGSFDLTLCVSCWNS